MILNHFKRLVTNQSTVSTTHAHKNTQNMPPLCYPLVIKSLLMIYVLNVFLHVCIIIQILVNCFMILNLFKYFEFGFLPVHRRTTMTTIHTHKASIMSPFQYLRACWKCMYWYLMTWWDYDTIFVVIRCLKTCRHINVIHEILVWWIKQIIWIYCNQYVLVEVFHNIPFIKWHAGSLGCHPQTL